MQGSYYRWTRPSGDSPLKADILGGETHIYADPQAGTVHVTVPKGNIDADTARMIGVRLIEAAALADNGRSVREP